MYFKRVASLSNTKMKLKTLKLYWQIDQRLCSILQFLINSHVHSLVHLSAHVSIHSFLHLSIYLSSYHRGYTIKLNKFLNLQLAIKAPSSTTFSHFLTFWKNPRSERRNSFLLKWIKEYLWNTVKVTVRISRWQSTVSGMYIMEKFNY